MKQRGFTLIELLAVIVILAIIMVIAVPQILNVIDSSRTSAWTNSAKLLKEAIVTNTTLYEPTTGAAVYTIPDLCSTPSKLSEIADLGDMKDVTCTPNATSNKYTFNLEGKNQFDEKYAKIICTKEGSCTVKFNIDDAIGCPDCVYARFSNQNIKYYGTNGSVLSENEYEKKWKTITDTGETTFLGMILDENGKITRGFACGYRNETAFCIEGANGAAYQSNVDLIKSLNIWNGTCQSYQTGGQTQFYCNETQNYAALPAARTDGSYTYKHNYTLGYCYADNWNRLYCY